MKSVNDKKLVIHLFELDILMENKYLKINRLHILPIDATYLVIWLILAHGEHHWLEGVINIVLKPEFVLLGFLISLLLL
jgi:hypothetical protein